MTDFETAVRTARALGLPILCKTHTDLGRPIEVDVVAWEETAEGLVARIDGGERLVVSHNPKAQKRLVLPSRAYLMPSPLYWTGWRIFWWQAVGIVIGTCLWTIMCTLWRELWK